MSEVTEEMKHLLKHMLGADSRYLKRQWGFRNHYCTTEGSTSDPIMRKMVALKLAIRSKRELFGGQRVYHATRLGAIAIGFKAYQLCNTVLAK